MTRVGQQVEGHEVLLRPPLEEMPDQVEPMNPAEPVMMMATGWLLPGGWHPTTTRF